MTILLQGDWVRISLRSHPESEELIPDLLLSFDNPDARQLVLNACQPGNPWTSTLTVEAEADVTIIRDIESVDKLLNLLPQDKGYMEFINAINHHLSSENAHNTMVAGLPAKLAQGKPLNPDERQHLLALLATGKKAPA